jgi:hypothetical protein
MKIAVIGSGPLAIEAAAEFLHEGADVRVIGQGDLGTKIKFLAENFGELPIEGTDYTRARTRERLNLNNIPTDFKSLWENYYSPLIDELRGHVYGRKVLRVQKRFLHQTEEIKDHSRLYDLFRVTYGLNPSGMVDEQLKENPELAEKLEGNILDSLKSQVESFEDFDLVFDTRGPFQNPLPLGSGENFALNERALKEMGSFLYGFDALRDLEAVKEHKKVTIVGDGALSALTFLSLFDWLQSGDKVLNIVTDKERTFESFFNSNHFSSLQEKVRTLISDEMNSWRESCQQTEKEILKWRELPQYERVKVPQPQFPEPRLRLFEGYSVSSCDKLIDQQEIFMTMEIPPWRNPEDEKRDLVTLGQDCIIGQKGFAGLSQDFASAEMLRAKEPGYFPISHGEQRLPKDGFEALEKAREDIFRFFSRA